MVVAVRILHLDPDDIDNPLSGGGPVRTYEIYRRLAARHEITVLTPTFPGSTPEKHRSGIRYLRLGRKIGDHGSSHHITFFFKLPAAIRRFEYDLIVEDFMPPASATFNPLFAKAPMIASVQWHFAEQLSRQFKIPFWIWERYGVKLYRNFIVLTESMRRSIEDRNRHAVCRVIPNGVDEDLFELPPAVGDFLLYLGRLDFEQKGVDLLLAAYAKIPAASRIPLLLAGHAVDYDAIRARVQALGLDDDVTIRERVDIAERNRLLSACRAVCVPSRIETFGMVITEACAAAKPVVLFDRPPMNEVMAPEACVAVPAFDTDALASALTLLTAESDGALANRGARCRQWARRYQWNNVAAMQEAFYLEILDRSGGVQR